MGMCSDPPPPPDLSGQVEAMKEYTATMERLAGDQLNWSKKEFAENKKLLDQVMDIQLPIMQENARTAKEDRNFWEETYKPLEEKLVAEANSFDTESRREDEAGQAVADVTTGFEAQRKNAQRELEGFGIDPSQTRSQAIDADIRVQEAAAQAGAANNARRNVENTARGLRTDAINVGRGYAGNVNAAYNTANNSGNSAISNSNSTFTAGSNANNSAIGNFQAVGNGIQGTSSIINSGYQNELSSFNAGNAITGAIAGGVAGAGAAALMAEGGEIVGPGNGTSDSIPVAINAPGAVQTPGAVSNGEYIVPADVVKWKGLEHMEKMISSSKQAISERAPVNTPNGVSGVVPPPQQAVRG